MLGGLQSLYSVSSGYSTPGCRNQIQRLNPNSLPSRSYSCLLVPFESMLKLLPYSVKGKTRHMWVLMSASWVPTLSLYSTPHISLSTNETGLHLNWYAATQVGKRQRSVGKFSMSQPVFSALLADMTSVKPVRLPHLAAQSLHKPTY
jgi:hypothetical protein